jgi:hypothetical protein
MIALWPAPIDECLNPAVFEKTNTRDCALTLNKKEKYRREKRKDFFMLEYWCTLNALNE